MATTRQLKFGTMTLELSEPQETNKDLSELIGILKSDQPSVEMVRQLRDADRIREEKRQYE